jgi:hypothetical protein
MRALEVRQPWKRVTILIAVAALVMAIIAFIRTGGIQDVRRQVDALGIKTDTVRDRTADTLDRLERLIRGREEPGSGPEHPTGGPGPA